MTRPTLGNSPVGSVPIAAPETGPLESVSTEVCKNCSTPLGGPFCHQCGQPSKSIIRFFGSLITELLEDIISLDSRALRTFFALLFRPGYLTKEYLSGRRFSYVPPLRLFLITSILCIFIVWVMNKTSDLVISDSALSSSKQTDLVSGDIPATIPIEDHEEFDKLTDAEKQKIKQEVAKANQMLSKFGTPELTVDAPNPAIKSTEQKNESAHENHVTDRHLLEQKITDQDQVDRPPNLPEAVESTESTQLTDNNDESVGIQLNKKTDEIKVSLPFLSKEDNQSLEQAIEEKYKKAKDDPKELFEDFISMIPKSMLLFVPLFALMMKLAYPFARRYYIEHLIHAFHGHSFLFLAIILLITLELTGSKLESSLSGVVQFIGSTFKFLEALLFIWLPIYYLISLRRVYQQHWLLTIVKWGLLGFTYFIMSVFSAVLVLIISLLLS